MYLHCGVGYVELTKRGWDNFRQGALSLPEDYYRVRELAATGSGNGLWRLEDQLGEAVKEKPPDPSAALFAAQLIEALQRFPGADYYLSHKPT